MPGQTGKPEATTAAGTPHVQTELRDEMIAVWEELYEAKLGKKYMRGDSNRTTGKHSPVAHFASTLDGPTDPANESAERHNTNRMAQIDLLSGAGPMNLMDDETYCTVVLDHLHSTPESMQVPPPSQSPSHESDAEVSKAV